MLHSHWSNWQRRVSTYTQFDLQECHAALSSLATKLGNRVLGPHNYLGTNIAAGEGQKQNTE